MFVGMDGESGSSCEPGVPNPVIAPHSAEKSSVLALYDFGYFRSFLA
jgi:hypothetical protein